MSGTLIERGSVICFLTRRVRAGFAFAASAGG
jgi:hypothetical protein